ncbi:MAG: hypothetical protein RIS90_1818 [Pseudomonadota bacterium]
MRQRLPLWSAAVWWVSLTALGAWTVPLLFTHLPTPALAGGMAAKLFTAQTWVSLVCGLGLLIASRSNQPPDLVAPSSNAIIFIVGGMLLALLAEFAVAPRIVLRENLRLWHSLGSAMLLLQWLCATVTFWALSGPRPRAQV